MIELRPLRLSWRFIRVWQRNMIVYKKIWKISFIPPILEPLFYLLAFGIGLGAFVQKVSYLGTDLSYVVFITPSLLAINVMQNAFFENTYASFVRMYYQKTFDAIMATPLSIEEVIAGEIIWGATKSTLATILMLGVISAFGLIHYPHGLLVIPLAFLGGMAFGSVGMLFTAIVKSIDLFNLPVFLFVTPMFLFSGTFFPIENLPPWAQKIALVLPLTHLVTLTRHFCLGLITTDLLWEVCYLAVFCLIFFPSALALMHRRLIQ